MENRSSRTAGAELAVGAAKDSIQGKASEMPAALSMVLRFIWNLFEVMILENNGRLHALILDKKLRLE